MRWVASTLSVPPSPKWYLCLYPCTTEPGEFLDKIKFLEENNNSNQLIGREEDVLNKGRGRISEG